MSIFKETFKGYVKNQIELRQSILGQNLEGMGRFHPKNIGNGVQLPTGAFHTYTTNKQSYIRMASCVDIIDEKGSSSEYEGAPYEDFASILGSGLAQRYILEGGTLDVSKSSILKKTFQPREGGVGNKLGDAYGDPFIRSDAKDGFGIVPMPGIKSVSTKTETAYGSLRTAKIEWECHNQRQLDVLEKLYLRPGYPILLEWGWTPFIDNRGDRITTFPLISDGDEFWDADVTQEELLYEIIEKKKLSSGNYDGMFGIIKNFNCAVTDLGGYQCTTEVISQGDVLDALKGRTDRFPISPPPDANDSSDTANPQSTNLKSLLDSLHWYSNSVGHQESPLSYYQEGVEIVTSALTTPTLVAKNAAVALVEKAEAATKAIAGFFGFGDDDENDTSEAVDDEEVDDTEDLNIIQASYQEAKAVMPGSKQKAKISDIKGQLLDALGTEERPCTEEELSSIIKSDRGPLSTDSSEGEGDKKIEFTEPYIRWDAFAHLLNKFVIERTNKGGKENDQSKPIVSFQTNQYLEEENDFDENNLQKGVGNRIEPITYEPFLNFEGLDEFDFCVDPSAGILANQLATESSQPPNFDKIYPFYYGFDKDDFLKKTNYEFKEGHKVIGHTYLNISMLISYYTSISQQKGGFNLGQFIKKIWDGISEWSGNHKFVVHSDYERPNIIRIIDLNATTENDIFQKAFTLNILGNDSICRKSTYNTSIPSSLTATIAIGAQDPKNINNIGSVTWDAFNRGIQNRFYKSPPIKDKEEKELEKEKNEDNDPVSGRNYMGWDTRLHTPKEIYEENIWLMDHEEGEDEWGWYGWETQGYKQQIEDFKKAIADGDYQVSKEGGLAGVFSETAEQRADSDDDDTEALDDMKLITKKAQALSEWFKMHDKKGELIPEGSAPPAIIPIKFQCELDGISGIVIGNVFKIDPSRLPKAYQNKRIAFIVMAVSQKITAGQDWTTEITGQIQLFDGDGGPNYLEPKPRKASTNKKAKLDNAGGSGVGGDVYGGTPPVIKGKFKLRNGGKMVNKFEDLYPHWEGSTYYTAYKYAPGQSGNIRRITRSNVKGGNIRSSVPENTPGAIKLMTSGKGGAISYTKGGGVNNSVYDLVFLLDGKNRCPLPSPISGKVNYIGRGTMGSTEIIGAEGRVRMLHMDSYVVKAGDQVKEGQIIGRQSDIMNSRGISPNVHLHIECPEKVLRKYIKKMLDGSYIT